MTLLILCVGLLIVIGGILRLHLHAFVALILAGIAVSLLTPPSLVTRSAQLESVVHQSAIDADQNLVLTRTALSDWKAVTVVCDVQPGRELKKVGSLSGQVDPALWTRPLPFMTAPDGASSTIDATTTAGCYRLEFLENEGSPFPGRLLLVTTKGFAAAESLGRQTFMDRLTTALGSYCGSLAILIVSASIIGRCLLDSGAADRIVQWTVNLVGEKNAPAAFVISGFTLSIPVFFDTVFYLMIPLGKALRRRTGGNYLLYVLAIVAGGTMAHSLVPPTPGPLFIAEAFGVPMGSMIVGGIVVGLFGAAFGMMYAFWVNRRYELQLPDEDDGPAVTDVFGTSRDSAKTSKGSGLFDFVFCIVWLWFCFFTEQYHMPRAPRADEAGGLYHDPRLLSSWPLSRLPNWVERVNEPLSKQELDAVRLSANRGRPLGDETWVESIARRRNLESTMRPRGRPRVRFPDDGPLCFSCPLCFSTGKTRAWWL